MCRKADVILPFLYGCGGNIDHAVKMAKMTHASMVVPVHTGGNEEVIKKYLDRLPENVKSAYFKEGKIIISE